jgi:DNA repair exonuclease SbcCD ATPase subunit
MSLESLDILRRRVNERLADLRASERDLREEGVAWAAAEDAAVDAEEAQKVVQLVAQTVQQKAHDRIAGVVSRCLEAVFDEPYEFKINFEQKRGRTEASLVFVREGLSVDPLTASGGGVVDVAAFALRLSCLLLARPPLRRTVVLDEPFRFVSEGYRPRVRQMLEQLSKELEVQFVVVTHDEAYKTGKVIELG